MSVANNLQSIVNALKANNVVIGSNNLVEGRGNILIGNNDIVRGNSLWVFASDQKVGGDQLLIMGNFRIDMNNVYGILHNPSSVISCLNPNQSRDYFALFGVNSGAVPSHLASQINGVRLLIWSFISIRHVLSNLTYHSLWKRHSAQNININPCPSPKRNNNTPSVSNHLLQSLRILDRLRRRSRAKLDAFLEGSAGSKIMTRKIRKIKSKMQ